MRRRLGEEESGSLVVLHDVPSLRQVGPMCGISAVAMVAAVDTCRRAGACLFPGEEVDVVDVWSGPIKAAAVEAGYSVEGEMFVAAELAELALSVLPLRMEVEHVVWEEVVVLEERVEEVAGAVEAGGGVLVAYDAAPNHEPEEKGGHAAHWALVVGVVRVEDGVWFVVRHGKSSRLGLWGGEALMASNAQLREARPDRIECGRFRVPGAGLDTVLASQAVFVHHLV